MSTLWLPIISFALSHAVWIARHLWVYWSWYRLSMELWKAVSGVHTCTFPTSLWASTTCTSGHSMLFKCSRTLYTVWVVPDVVCCWNDPGCCMLLQWSQMLYAVGMITDVVCCWNDHRCCMLLEWSQMLYAGREHFQVLSSLHMCVVCLHSVTFESFPSNSMPPFYFSYNVNLHLPWVLNFQIIAQSLYFGAVDYCTAVLLLMMISSDREAYLLLMNGAVF